MRKYIFSFLLYFFAKLYYMKFFKILLAFFLLFIINQLLGQNFFKDLRIYPVIGIRSHTNGLPNLRPGGKPLLITAPLIGFEISAENSPISLSIQKDWNVEYVPHTDLSQTLGYSINQYWRENNFLLNYEFSQDYRVGAGYYFMRRENSLNQDLGNSVVRDYQGLLLSVSKRLDWLMIELRTKVTLKPSFGALGSAQHSLVFSYHFKKEREVETTESKFDKHFQLNAVLGTRFFPISGVKVLRNEKFGAVGIAPTLGIELLYKKYNLSFNIEKDVWLSLNGGSSRREIKGHIASTLIGVKYHPILKNERHIRIGVGYSLIRDLDKMALITDPSPYNLKGLEIYQVKGIGASLSYELFSNADVELKHTFPIRSLDEKLLNPIRFSAGIIYRINP